MSDLERSIQVTVFQWPISLNLFKITTELLLVMDWKSYMRFHLEPLSLTLSDIERSHRGHTSFQWHMSSNLFKITTEFLLMMDRKSYMRFIWHHCLWPRVTWRGQAYFRGL